MSEDRYIIWTHYGWPYQGVWPGYGQYYYESDLPRVKEEIVQYEEKRNRKMTWKDDTGYYIEDLNRQIYTIERFEDRWKG